MRGHRLLPLPAALLAAGLLTSVAAADDPAKDATLADRLIAEFQPGVANDRDIRLGSIGSGMFRTRTDRPHEYWMVTDRGPNGQPGGRRTFPVPDFAPSLVNVRVRGERVDLLERIPLTSPDGEPVTGLSNLAAVTSPLSATPPTADEVPYAFDGTTPLGRYEPNGLDTEDVVRSSDGDFWVVDEYRPSVVRVDAGGTVLTRYVPDGLAAQMSGADYPVVDTLPAAYAYRRQNRGFEGLAVTPDGRSLLVGLQSPLQLPPNPNVGRDSRNTRILRLDRSGEVTGEFVYRFDVAATFDPTPGTRARDMKVSGLYAISDTQLLVLERTDFVAKVYLVDLSAATDLGTWTPPAGAPLNYVESLNADGALEAAGIVPLPKKLVIDLDTVTGMPDKIESVAVVNPSVLAVANDNDFGLTDEPTWDADGNLASDTGVASRILYVTLPESLPLGPVGRRP